MHHRRPHQLELLSLKTEAELGVHSFYFSSPDFNKNSNLWLYSDFLMNDQKSQLQISIKT